MSNVNDYVNQLADNFKRLIETFKKYNIRHIPNVGENFIEIAFVIDDIHANACKSKPEVKCKRINDYYAYILETKANIDSIRFELKTMLDNIPYQLHPDFTITKNGDSYLVVMAIYDDDIINAIKRQININPRANITVTIDKYNINKVVWVKIGFEW